MSGFKEPKERVDWVVLLDRGQGTWRKMLETPGQSVVVANIYRKFRVVLTICPLYCFCEVLVVWHILESGLLNLIFIFESNGDSIS